MKAMLFLGSALMHFLDDDLCLPTQMRRPRLRPGSTGRGALVALLRLLPVRKNTVPSRVPAFEGFMIPGIQRGASTVPGFHRVPGLFQGSRIPGFQDSRVPGLEGSTFQGFRSLGSAQSDTPPLPDLEIETQQSYCCWTQHSLLAMLATNMP